jgi:hypothetical protein
MTGFRLGSQVLIGGAWDFSFWGKKKEKSSQRGHRGIAQSSQRKKGGERERRCGDVGW